MREEVFLLILKRLKGTDTEGQKRLGLAEIVLVIVFLGCCFIGNAFAETGITAGEGKIGPLLKKEISQTPQSQLSENHGVDESQTSASNEILTKVIVVLDADYLEPLAADLLHTLQEKVEALGGRLGRHAFNNVQVWISLERIQELAAWSRIKLIKEPTKPKTNDVMSDSLQNFGAGSWQAGGITGKGVKVGIVDAGFSGYADLLGSTLPARVVTKSLGSSFYSSRHGTACAEIVHALAPDATLYLVNIDDIEVDFIYAVRWLQAQGVKVISSSIGLNLKIFCQQAYEVMWVKQYFLIG